MNKVFQYVSYLTILVTLGLMLLVSYWLTYPYKPITFNNLPFKVSNKTIRTGGVLVYKVDYCKHNTLIPSAKKTFVDEIIYSIPAETVLAKQIGCHVINIQINVPDNLPPSTYVLKVTYQYKVNPIKTINISVETEEFEVIK